MEERTLSLEDGIKETDREVRITSKLGHYEKIFSMDNRNKWRRIKLGQRHRKYFQQNNNREFSNLKRCLSKYKKHTEHQIERTMKETPHDPQNGNTRQTEQRKDIKGWKRKDPSII